MDRARRRDGRAGRRAAADEPVERRGRQGRGGRDAAAGHRQVAAVIPPPRLVVPETAAAAKARGPTQDELFASIWGSAGPNNQDGATGDKWFPLPPKAPEAEWTIFVFPKSAKTELEVADILIKSYYEDECNKVADKRREVCHFLSRPGELNQKELTALKQELQVLFAKVVNKGKLILDRTGYEVDVPGYFSKFPALQG